MGLGYVFASDLYSELINFDLQFFPPNIIPPSEFEYQIILRVIINYNEISHYGKIEYNNFQSAIFSSSASSSRLHWAYIPQEGKDDGSLCGRPWGFLGGGWDLACSGWADITETGLWPTSNKYVTTRIMIISYSKEDSISDWRGLGGEQERVWLTFLGQTLW